MKGLTNVHLLEPLDYRLMNKAHIILTDSRGCRRKLHLGKPVLVMRDVTQRVEGIQAGTAKMIGTSMKRIVKEILGLLRDEAAYKRMAKAVNPYGDGTACKQIRKIPRGGLFPEK